VTDGHSAIALDRTASFQALYFGHIANYQSRGVYNAPEQLSLYGDGGAKGTRYYSDSFRAQVGAGEVDIGAETNVLRFFCYQLLPFIYCPEPVSVKHRSSDATSRNKAVFRRSLRAKHHAACHHGAVDAAVH
jgi:hypothetical protein